MLGARRFVWQTKNIFLNAIGVTAILIDERDGRETVIQRGLRAIGTLRVLYDAAEAGLCDLTQAFDQLRATNFRASESLYQSFLRLPTGQQRTQPGTPPAKNE